MRDGLRSRFLYVEPSPRGQQAVILLIEPNGDEHKVRCLVIEDKTEICGDNETLEYLNDRYDALEVVLNARRATLSGFAR